MRRLAVQPEVKMVSYYDRIMDQAAVILRGYVIERFFRAEGIQMSPEELGGTPNELQGHELKEMVDGLLEITEELNTNAELQHLISEVPVYCIQDVFFATTKEIFTDGINFGKVAAVHHLACKLIHRAHSQNQPQVMVNIINWTLQFIREYICKNSWPKVLRMTQMLIFTKSAASVCMMAICIYSRML
uniref:Bcl-2 Bcl-2 homology region 1-3 domain-containing protein n=1 Tax=Salmo trutta TaxID=8032 RepID=A0A673ZGM9_SALTR